MGLEPRPLEALRKALYKAENEHGLDMLRNAMLRNSNGELFD
jgi:hypothetical protein